MIQKVRRIYRADDIAILMSHDGHVVIIAGYNDLSRLMGRRSATACWQR
jgi:hypothetical protein